MLDDTISFKEFQSKPFSIEQRKELNYSDEFVVRRAKIYSVLGPEDDRLQVQVLPELQGIEEEEMDDLPKYPPFIQGTVITGKDQKNDGDAADFVWVFCTPDLQVGYVLGLSNPFANMDKDYKEHSYKYSSVKEFLQNRQALPEDFDYNHIMIRNWVASDQGGMIECYNYLTGDWVILNTSGSIITLQQKQIYMRVGTPPNPPQSGPAAFTAVTMTADKFHLKSPNIEFDAQQVILAHHGSKVLGSAAAGILVGKNGVSATIFPDVAI